VINFYHASVERIFIYFPLRENIRQTKLWLKINIFSKKQLFKVKGCFHQ